MNDVIKRPPHYQIIPEKGVEVRDIQQAVLREYIEHYAYDSELLADTVIQYGNVIKYLSRAPRKRKLVEDLKKAQFELSTLIDRIEEYEESKKQMDLPFISDSSSPVSPLVTTS